MYKTNVFVYITWQCQMILSITYADINRGPSYDFPEYCFHTAFPASTDEPRFQATR